MPRVFRHARAGGHPPPPPSPGKTAPEIPAYFSLQAVTLSPRPRPLPRLDPSPGSKNPAARALDALRLTHKDAVGMDTTAPAGEMRLDDDNNTGRAADLRPLHRAAAALSRRPAGGRARPRGARGGGRRARAGRCAGKGRSAPRFRRSTAPWRASVPRKASSSPRWATPLRRSSLPNPSKASCWSTACAWPS